MIRRHALLVLTVVAALAGASFCVAEPLPRPKDKAPRDRAVAAAERNVELAQLAWRRFNRVEYPTKLRRLESEIKLNEAEIASHKRRIKEYEQFERNKYSSPLFLSIEDTKLALLAAELRLKDLSEERALLIQFRDDQNRALELDIEAAQEQLDALAPRK